MGNFFPRPSVPSSSLIPAFTPFSPPARAQLGRAGGIEEKGEICEGEEDKSGPLPAYPGCESPECEKGAVARGRRDEGVGVR